MPTPRQAYRKQKANAKSRGIAFLMTFEEWWAVWEESKCWNGRGRRGFVMHRFNDDGPYEVGNVEIVSAVDNFNEAMEKYR